VPFEGQMLIRVLDKEIGKVFVHDLNVMSMTGEVVERGT